jgi:Uncharacterised nucleotidyltransferase
MTREQQQATRQVERLIRLAANTAVMREERAEHAEELAREIDWTLVGERLTSRRLLTLLGPRILELTGAAAGRAFTERVKSALETERRRGLFISMSSSRVRDCLGGAGIQTTELKGVALSEALYGDPGRRPCGDIDLLLPSKHLHDGIHALRVLGYQAASDHTDRSGLPLLHFTLFHGEDRLPRVELHWRVHWYERRFAQAQLLPPAGSDAERWSPAAVDDLVTLLLVYARDGFLNLRHAVDLAAWWDTYGPQLAHCALEERIQTYPALRRVLLVALAVAEQTVGLPAAELSSERAPSVRAWVASRLAGSAERASESQLHAQMGLIDGLLAPGHDLPRFIRRQVWVPRPVLREQANRGTDAESPLAHGLRTVGRYALAMGRMPTGRSARTGCSR